MRRDRRGIGPAAARRSAAVGAGLLIAAAAPSARADEAALAHCADRQAAVLAALHTRDDMRDEAYTAIMWARLDAEAAYRAGDGPACLAHLELPRRALGLHEESLPRR